MQKYQAIEAWRAEFPVQVLCRVLQVTRSGYYAWRQRPLSGRAHNDAALRERLQIMFLQARGCYGAPRLHAELQAAGERVGRKRVARLLREAGLSARRNKRFVPRTTVVDGDAPVYANTLARDFHATVLNAKWVSDITYIPTGEGWLYVAGIMDLYSRRVVGLAMDERMPAELVLRAWHMAVEQCQPPATLLHHSDRGSQYTSQLYQSALAGKAQVSMSDVGQCWDNAPMESFWATLKGECLRQPFATREAARVAIFEYVMVFYNRQRRHSALGYLSPVAFEQQALRTV